jgi:glycine betaine/proline transport system ATP-binding protein
MSKDEDTADRSADKNHQSGNTTGDGYLIRVEHLTKYFGGNKMAVQKLLVQGKTKNDIFKQTGAAVAVNDVSFSVRRGEIYVLIGLSGSGKSTVIRCLNGLIKPTSGTIRYDGSNIENFSKDEMLDFRRRKISMVFQNFGLMGHRNVLENVAYGLEIRGMKRAERTEKAMQVIDMVGLGGWEKESIQNLSGGMRQRVGIARALANDPEVLLMDEPFSALDPLVRNDMQFELLSLQEKLNKTVVFITHDINEAFKLGNTVSIMKDGSIVQTDTPEGMATNPADEYVKNFIDSADKAKVYKAANIMIPPSCIIHSRDGARNALQQMRSQEVSSAYIVDDRMEFVGIMTLDDAIRVKEGKIPFEQAVKKDVPETAPDTQISELLSMAAAAVYPLAVLDSERHLKGIITKAAVLASLS